MKMNFSIKTKKLIFLKLWRTKRKYFLDNSMILIKYAKTQNKLSYGLYLVLIFIKTEIVYLKQKNISAKEENYWLSDIDFKIDKDNIHYKNNYVFQHMDAFSFNISIWDKFFKKKKLISTNLEYLEIGTFEGRASVFVLENLVNANCTFVDPFMEYDEMKNTAGYSNLSPIYENFLQNISKFPERYEFFKESSDSFFKNCIKNFDLVYIDGSHYGEDVYRDAVNSFKLLNKEGFIIFDDFFWFHFPSIDENPLGGIFKFLIEFEHLIKICYVSNQLIIMKK